MRTLVDIPEEELKQLNQISKKKRVSRAHLVRCAISNYLNEQPKDSLDKFFGIWADRKIDGLEYQLKMRSEWDHRP